MNSQRKFNVLKLAFGLALGSAALNASAVTYDISTDPSNYTSNNWVFSDGANPIDPSAISASPSNPGQPATYYQLNGDAFWTAALNFTGQATHGADFIISAFTADDRAEVLLNGQVMDAAGLFAPGAGYFQGSPTGPVVPVNYLRSPGVFDYGNSLTLTNVALNSGINTVEIIVNNTNNGIGGTSLQAGGPTHVTLDAIIFVPEPATLALLASGLLGLTVSWRKFGGG